MQPKSLTALVVDDEPNIVTAIEFLLQKEGYIVLKAYNGADALRIAEQSRPDVILLDVMMPGGIDGFEVARRIRQSSGLDHSKIIFLTARGTQADKIAGYSNGGEHYLVKPFDNDELVMTVSEVAIYG